MIPQHIQSRHRWSHGKWFGQKQIWAHCWSNHKPDWESLKDIKNQEYGTKRYAKRLLISRNSQPGIAASMQMICPLCAWIAGLVLSDWI